jgi:hypothetical protein
MTTAYEELLDRTKELSSEERLRLADTLLAEELGFGMWLNRADVQDAAEYVDRTREESMRAPNGSLKSPDEFLKEVETFSE